MYVVRYSGGSHAFPVKGLEDALKSPHFHTRERAATLLQQSLTAAQKHATVLRKQGHKDVQVLRAGSPFGSKGWSRETIALIKAPAAERGELRTRESAWTIPAGYVDTEADKHGPVVTVPVSQLSPLRTNAEKAAWFSTYKPIDKLCLWQ